MNKFGNKNKYKDMLLNARKCWENIDNRNIRTDSSKLRLEVKIAH